MANNIKTSLYQAIKNNDIKAVEDALKMGADVNSSDFRWDQGTALTEACKNGNKDICRLLIDKGAQIGSMDKYDNHPIHYACLNGHSDIAEILVQNGENVNIIGHSRRTPLHCACSKKQGNRNVIRKLISIGADVNARDGWDWTPLMVLAENCLTGIMEELIDAGADKSIKNRNGNTAKDILGAYCPDKVDDFEKYISKKARASIRARKKILKREDFGKSSGNVPDFDI